MRVLVTGSRDWPDSYVIWNALWAEANKIPVNETLTVVHGACPRGADAMASAWCADQAAHYEAYPGITIVEEPYPADWYAYGKRAGFIRDSEMVNQGADLCLAFIKDNSKGASMTARLAEHKGIWTVRYTQ